MTDHDTTDSISRRSVLKTAGGMLAGSTALASLGAGRGAAEESIEAEIRELTEEYIAVEARLPEDTADGVEFPDDLFLGFADEFVIHDDTVSLPEDTEGLANPIDADRLDAETYRFYFRTQEVDFSEADDEEVTMGFGLFTERTIPKFKWTTCPGHRDY